MTTPSYPRIPLGRAELLNIGAQRLASQPKRMQVDPNALARVKFADADHDEQIAAVAKMLNINDNASDWNRVAKLQRALEARGVNDVEDLDDLLGGGRFAHGYEPPDAPKASLSQLYSDVEVLDTVATDSIIRDISTVAISSTTTLTLAQMPMKWGFTDITVSGDVQASGSENLIEVRVILGTRTIMQFRLNQLSRNTNSGMVFDALQKLYQYEIGPNSTVQIAIENKNASVGQTFINGYVQYVYQPVIDASTARILRGGR